ncbi:hypothetical protein [Salmonella phage SSBI34]|nr:hypothetical protein [Salmonella phage SSBI34]
MILDIMAVLKALWGFATFILLGILKITYSDFKKMQERQDTLEKDIIRLRSEMVTKDSLDDIFDRKMKHIQDTIQDIRGDLADMRGETKDEVTALRNEIRTVLNVVLERSNRQ